MQQVRNILGDMAKWNIVESQAPDKDPSSNKVA